jgi:ABC-type branched-subunit amino acid transport system ATPase component
MSELLGFSGVESGYGDARVLHKVDMSIGEGERVAILGRNGVGKTTIVNTFLGAAHLTGGEVRLAGRRQPTIRNFTAARLGIAVVPQGRPIVPTLTIRENLMLGRHWPDGTVDDGTGVRAFSDTGREGQYRGNDAFGRPATNARDQPRADV